jgi:hypothetical protein
VQSGATALSPKRSAAARSGMRKAVIRREVEDIDLADVASRAVNILGRPSGSDGIGSAAYRPPLWVLGITRNPSGIVIHHTHRPRRRSGSLQHVCGTLQAQPVLRLPVCDAHQRPTRRHRLVRGASHESAPHVTTAASLAAHRSSANRLAED